MVSKLIYLLVAAASLFGAATPAWSQSCNGQFQPGQFCGNPQTGRAPPAGVEGTALFDRAFGATRGSLLERAAAGWGLITPGTSGLPFISTGPGSDPIYSVMGCNGLPALTGDITGSSGSCGTTFSPIGSGTVIANPTAGTTSPTASTVTSILDRGLGSTRGSIIERGSSAWGLITPGTSGLPLVSNGSGADPSYSAIGGTALGVTGPADLTVNTTGTIMPLPIFRPEDYGTVHNDCTTSDSTAINAAITALLAVGHGSLVFNGSSQYAVSTAAPEFKPTGPGAIFFNKAKICEIGTTSISPAFFPIGHHPDQLGGTLSHYATGNSEEGGYQIFLSDVTGIDPGDVISMFFPSPLYIDPTSQLAVQDHEFAAIVHAVNGTTVTLSHPLPWNIANVSVSTITAANPGVFTVNDTSELVTGQYLTAYGISGTMGTTLNGNVFSVVVIDGTHVSLKKQCSGTNPLGAPACDVDTTGLAGSGGNLGQPFTFLWSGPATTGVTVDGGNFVVGPDRQAFHDANHLLPVQTTAIDMAGCVDCSVQNTSTTGHWYGGITTRSNVNSRLAQIRSAFDGATSNNGDSCLPNYRNTGMSVSNIIIDNCHYFGFGIDGINYSNFANITIQNRGVPSGIATSPDGFSYNGRAIKYYDSNKNTMLGANITGWVGIGYWLETGSRKNQHYGVTVDHLVPAPWQQYNTVHSATCVSGSTTLTLNGASFTATIAPWIPTNGSLMTVTAVSSGHLAQHQTISGGGIFTNSTISWPSGTGTGGTGTYFVDIPQTIASPTSFTTTGTTYGILAGWTVSGACIAPGTTVVSVLSENTVQLSAAATSSTTTDVTIQSGSHVNAACTCNWLESYGTSLDANANDNRFIGLQIQGTNASTGGADIQYAGGGGSNAAHNLTLVAPVFDTINDLGTPPAWKIGAVQAGGPSTIDVDVINARSSLTASGSFACHVTAITSPVTLDGTYCTVMVDVSGGSIVQPLPAAAADNAGRIYRFIKSDSSADTLTVNGFSVIAGGAATLGHQWQEIVAQSDGTAWRILSTTPGIGTAGGVPFYSGAATIASSNVLDTNEIVLGGGSGNPPKTTVTGGLGTTTQVLHGNAAGGPSWAAVDLANDTTGILPNAALSGTYSGVTHVGTLNGLATTNEILMSGANETGTNCTDGVGVNEVATVCIQRITTNMTGLSTGFVVDHQFKNSVASQSATAERIALTVPSGNSTAMTSLVAMQLNAQSAGTGGVSVLSGSNYTTTNSGAQTVADEKALALTIQNTGGGTVTVARTLQITSPTGPSTAVTSTWTNIYGIEISDQKPTVSVGSNTLTNPPKAIRIQSQTATGAFAISQEGSGINAFAGSIINSGITTDATHTDATVCEDTTTHQFYFGSGALGVCLGTSGAQFKRDIIPMQAGLADIMKLKLINFRYRDGFGDNGARMQYGMTAQMVEQVLPGLVGHNTNGEAINFDMGSFVPISLHAIQELDHKMNRLSNRVRRLERRRHRLAEPPPR